MEAKSKTTAVLLALFLCPATWLYTYREDGRKFWAWVGIQTAGLLLALMTPGGQVLVFVPALTFYIWTIYGIARRPRSRYDTYNTDNENPQRLDAIIPVRSQQEIQEVATAPAGAISSSPAGVPVQAAANESPKAPAARNSIIIGVLITAGLVAVLSAIGFWLSRDSGAAHQPSPNHDIVVSAVLHCDRNDVNGEHRSYMGKVCEDMRSSALARGATYTRAVVGLNMRYVVAVRTAQGGGYTVEVPADRTVTVGDPWPLP